MKKNGADDSLYEQFGKVGKRVEFTREQLIERAKNSLKNNKTSIKTSDCIDYLNKLK